MKTIKTFIIQQHQIDSAKFAELAKVDLRLVYGAEADPGEPETHQTLVKEIIIVHTGVGPPTEIEIVVGVLTDPGPG